MIFFKKYYIIMTRQEGILNKFDEARKVLSLFATKFGTKANGYQKKP